jgi:phosphoenolpyruvate carboxylase
MEGRMAVLYLGYSRSMKKPTAPPPKLYTWSIYHIKGTPAALLGRVEAPDEVSAIKKAIEEFNVSPALQKRLLAQRR